MQKPVDFRNMTLDELTPIVSMRPGKEYTREEIRAARVAFMAQLGNSPDESADASEENKATKDQMECADETIALEETEAEVPAKMETEPELPMSAPENSKADAHTEAIDKDAPEEESSMPDFSFEAESTEIESATATTEAAPMTDEAPKTEPSAEESTEAEAEEEFILKAESRLARFLYVLYAYLLVPVLAAEALIFLLASVAAAVAVPNIPYLFVHILCAVLYTMIVSIAWHQFLHRTQFGLLLNRALIAVCIFRGISMLLSGDSLLPGVIFVALSSLFLVFFVGYDSTFTVKSPKKPHAQ